MSQSILIFEFGTNEEAAQQARHKIEGWKQGFRLGNKMLLKFDREESAEKSDGQQDLLEEPASAGKKSAGKKPAEKGAGNQKEESSGRVRLLVRLDFSDHEKLSHQRWLDRIPTEEPVKSATAETIRTGDPEFPKTADLFDSLD
jgi:hypothetical protein